jgi:hypothetical protein
MKLGWETKKLGEVCELYQPRTISSKKMIAGGEFTVFGANGPIGKLLRMLLFYNSIPFDPESTIVLVRRFQSAM